MKYTLALCICIFSCHLVASQDPPKVTPEVLSSGGDHFNTPDIKLDFTLGELAVETIGDNPQATQGFHQGELTVSTLVLNPAVQHYLRVYPNPAQSSVQVELKGTEANQIALFDANGRLWLKDEFHDTHQVDVSALPQGIYFLQIMSDRALIATSKIEKNH